MSVTLTLTEYNEMLENKRLLEDQNKELKTLHDKIEVLQKEKIEALKQNAHTVTMTKRTFSRQMIYVERPDFEILRRLEMLGIRTDRMQTGVTGKSLGMSGRELVEKLMDATFKMEDIVSQDYEDEVVYSRDLQEFKEEVRAQAVKDIANSVQKKLDSVDNLKADINRLENQVIDSQKRLKEETKLHTAFVESSQDEIDLLESKLKMAEEKLDEMKGFDPAKLEALENCVADIEYESRIIPIFTGKEIAKKVHNIADNTMRRLNIAKHN